MKKKCFKCGEVKSLTEFYRHKRMADGHVNKCKECNKRDVRDNRKDKVEYYREYDRKRFKEDPKVKQRHRNYQSTERGRESMRRSSDRWTEKNTIKKAASIMVNNAVRDGRLIKPSICEKCGSAPDRLHGHHPDYSKPLSVNWLCQYCHVAWHRENGEGANAH